MKDQKHIMQYPFFILVAFALMLNSCSKAQNNAPARSENYVILLDLSDRLLAPHQDKQDIVSILTVFEVFEKKVYRRLIVNSKDKFCVRIIPQEDSPLDTDSLNNLLMIDMSALPMSVKKQRLLAFKNQLKPLLENLYETAGQGKKTSDYQGVDIWRYFNEDLRYDLPEGYNNHLVVLTDGYFDFESYQFTTRMNNRFSSTIFFHDLQRDDWKAFAEKENYGLLPVNKKFPETKVTVIGINPKNKSLEETEKLYYFWEKWLREMNFRSHLVIRKNNSEHLKQILNQNNI